MNKLEKTNKMQKSVKKRNSGGGHHDPIDIQNSERYWQSNNEEEKRIQENEEMYQRRQEEEEARINEIREIIIQELDIYTKQYFEQIFKIYNNYFKEFNTRLSAIEHMLNINADKPTYPRNGGRARAQNSTRGLQARAPRKQGR